MALDARGYRIGAAIAGDQLSHVYEAEHPDLATPFVLKVWSDDLPRHAYDDSAYGKRARALIAIGDPRLVRILDFGYLAGPPVGHGGEHPYVAMERIGGEPLGRQGARTLDALVDVTVGLDAMHGAGLVHGALKPTSIMVGWELGGGGPYRGGESTRARLLGALGRPPLRGFWLGPGPMPPISDYCYVAPEQITGIASDARADVHAVGVMIHEAVCGAVPVPPAESDNFLGYLARRLKEKVMPPAETAAAHGRVCSPAMEAVIVKALHPDRRRRYQTAGELGRALAAARLER